MTYPPSPSQWLPGDSSGATKRRPGTVTVAVVLMLVLVVGSILLSLLAGIGLATLDVDNLREEMRREDPSISDEDIDAGITGIRVIGGVLIAVYAAIAIALGILAMFVLRGANGARIATWALSGLYLLCGVCAAVGGLVVATGGSGLLGAVMIVGPILLLIAAIVVIILLAVPDSNAYFRTTQPAPAPAAWPPPPPPDPQGWGQQPPPPPPAQ